MNNIAGISVATSANNNNIFSEIIVKVGIICPDHLKFNLTKYGRVDLGDGMKLVYVPTDDSILRVYLPDGNCFNVVKNHSVGTRCNWKYIAEQVQHIVCTHYNVPDPKNFATFNDWANDLYEYGFCSSDKRWAMFDKMTEEFRMEQSQSDWADFLDMCDRKEEIVSSYQTEIDGYVNDIIAIADKMENIENKVDAFAIKQIVYKIMHTEQDCYDAIMGAACDCFGTEIDLMGLWLWYNNYGQHYTDNNFSREDLDLEDLIDTLECMTSIEYDMPFATEEDKEYIDEEDPDNIDWLMGHNLPYYVAYEVGQYASSYYHYAYCA